MKPAIHAYLCDDTGHRFFGNGPMRLLQLIGETGSLRGAAQQMGLSYSKALAIVKRAEAELGFALTEKTIGGRGGGGSFSADCDAAVGYRSVVYRNGRTRLSVR